MVTAVTIESMGVTLPMKKSVNQPPLDH